MNPKKDRDIYIICCSLIQASKKIPIVIKSILNVCFYIWEREDYVKLFSETKQKSMPTCPDPFLINACLVYSV